MAATLKVYYDWGGSDSSPGTAHNVTDNGSNKIRFKTEDDATLDSNNPIPVPTSGTNRSFWKQVYMFCSTTGGALTKIDNIKFYSDGAAFSGYTGVDLMVGTTTTTKASSTSTGYNLAVGTSGTTGTVMTSHSGISATANATTYTSASPLSVGISQAGSQIDAINETTNYVVLQLNVANTASSGTLAAETLTFRYDEV